MAPLIGGIGISVNQQNDTLFCNILRRAIDVVNSDFSGFIYKRVAMLPMRIVDLSRVERWHCESQRVYDSRKVGLDDIKDVM